MKQTNREKFNRLLMWVTPLLMVVFIVSLILEL